MTSAWANSIAVMRPRPVSNRLQVVPYGMRQRDESAYRMFGTGAIGGAWSSGGVDWLTQLRMANEKHACTISYFKNGKKVALRALTSLPSRL